MVDECPRDTSLEKMAGLAPLLDEGRVTAALASQICDRAAAVLLASEAAVKTHGLAPRARIHHLSARGADPILMLTAPIPATAYALKKMTLGIDDMDVVEINKASLRSCCPGFGRPARTRRRSTVMGVRLLLVIRWGPRAPCRSPPC